MLERWNRGEGDKRQQRQDDGSLPRPLLSFIEVLLVLHQQSVERTRTAAERTCTAELLAKAAKVTVRIRQLQAEAAVTCM